MKRISKAAARKLWNSHENFIIVPCKCSPTGLGALYTRCDLGGCYEEDTTFDKFVNSFTYYNCNNETGRYPAFYLE